MKHRYLLVPLLALAACQSPPPALEALPAPPADAAGAAPPRVSGAIATNEAAASAPNVSEGTAPGMAVPRTPKSGAEGDVTLNFVDTDIREITRQILGTLLQVNYTIDPSVHGTATLETPRALPRAELLPTLMTLLNQNGATMIRSGALYRVLPSASAGALPSLATDGVTSGTQLVMLRYASARDLAKTLEPFIATGAKVAADPTRNALLITGEPAARATIAGLIQAFDVDLLAGQSYALFPVASGDPGKVAGELQRVFQTEGDGALANLVRIIPMERVNAVLVVAGQPRYIDDARRLFNLIDRVRRDTARSWHVYYVQNGQSSDLANLLQRAFTPGNVTATAPGSTAPGQSTRQIDSSGSSSGSGSGFSNGSNSGGGFAGSGLGQNDLGQSGGSVGGLGQSGSSGSGGFGQDQGGQDQGPQPDEDQGPSAEGLSSGGGGNTHGIRIIANPRNNAVLIYATPDEESTVEALLHKVDIQPLQVRIDATIAEVTLNDNLQYGTQFFFKNGGLNGALSSGTAAVTSAAGLVQNFPGFVLNKASGGVNFALSALQSVTNVRVLSSPQVMVLDNQAARLQVGNLVPYLTQSSQSTTTADAPVITNIDYRETGVILQVVPRVNNGGLVNLDISQEVSDVSDTASTVANTPTFLERRIRSRVVVQDGQTIGLAGLIRDTTSQGNAGIPFLKDIPILGSAFSNQNNTRQRTELIVLITPHVMEDQREARALTEDLRQKLINAGMVPQELRAKGLSGSPNPNAVLTR